MTTFKRLTRLAPRNLNLISNTESRSAIAVTKQSETASANQKRASIASIASIARSARSASFLGLAFKFLVGASAGVATSGCAALMTNHTSTPARQTSQTEVRDVPSQARDKNDQSPRKRVMVLPFLADDGVNTTPATQRLAREYLLREIRRSSDDFVFVPPTDFPKDVASFVKNGAYDLEAMAKLASQMGLAALIEGRITSLTAKRTSDPVGLVRQVRAKIDVTAGIRMVNAKNGKLMLDESRSATAEDEITRVAERANSDKGLQNDPKLVQDVVVEAFRNTAPKVVQLIDKLGWEGRVAMIKNEKMYLNAGRLSGLQVGDILKVLEDGEDVYDPETGSLIGHVPGRVKGTVEVISYFGKDGSVAVVHSGSGFKESDKVELY